MLKRILTVLLTAAVVSGCALLPFAAALWQDHSLLGQVESESIEPITLRAADSSLLDRLRLCSANQLYCEVQNMPIGTGVRYQEDTIIEQARAQLRLLCEASGVLRSEPAYNAAKMLGIDFLADPGDPTNNAMVWRVGFYSDSGSAEVLVDDASGLIIALVADDIRTTPAARELDGTAAVWAAYLGLAVVETAREEQVIVTDHAAVDGIKTAEKAPAMTYRSVTLAHPDEPDGFHVQYLLRATENSLWITIA